MTVAGIEVMIERLEHAAARSPQPAGRRRSVVILGKPTETNCDLAAAFADLGQRVQLAAAIPPRLRPGDLALARFDVLPTLDGVEPGLWRLTRLERRGVHVMNGSVALFAAHDKLSTALFLGRARVEQPRTAHLRDWSLPTFSPPYVVKPRFGSWGRDVSRRSRAPSAPETSQAPALVPSPRRTRASTRRANGPRPPRRRRRRPRRRRGGAPFPTGRMADKRRLGGGSPARESATRGACARAPGGRCARHRPRRR
jgi:hypothetical protein